MFTKTSLTSLSMLRRGNLRRRLLDRCVALERKHGEDSPQHRRACAVLGRFAALTT